MMDHGCAPPDSQKDRPEPLVANLTDFAGRGTRDEVTHAPQSPRACGRPGRASCRHSVVDRMESTNSPMSEEERLVARCLGGDPAAWQTLFDLYHPRLLFIIKGLIGAKSGVELAEEIAAAVWSS